MPGPPQLKAIRNYIAENGDEFEEIINAPDFKKVYPEMYNHQLKTAPRGFSQNHEFIHLLRYKSFVFAKYTDSTPIFENSIVVDMVHAYRTLYPVNIFLNTAIREM